MSEELEPIEASEQEAKNEEARKSRRNILVIPLEEGEDITLVIPYRWKRAAFSRCLSSADLWGALEAIWPPVPVIDEETGEPELDPDGEPVTETNPELVPVAEAEMSDREYQLLIQKVAQSLMGKSAAQGKARRT